MGRRRLPGPSDLKRRKAQRPPKLEIWVFCEGKTEKHYLDWFIKECRIPRQLVRVEVVGESGVPMTLVGKAVEKRRELKKAAQRSTDSFAEAFAVWGVPDVDEHPRLADARERARQAGVDLAVSNPCFELWGLLHLRDQTAPIHRHKLQRLLAETMTGYHHEQSPYFVCEQLRGKYEAAKQRALNLEKRSEEADDPGGNPSTDIHRLLDLLRQNGQP